MESNCPKQRPWLTPCQQVEHLASKGVTFAYCSPLEAEEYLRAHNSYFRVRSYRANFYKYEEGPKAGQYIGLDFAMLVDLAVIDMNLRGVFLVLTLDIEHYAKLRLLNELEAAGEDGYTIVQSFLNDPHNIRANGNLVLQEIERGLSSPYTSGLILHHPDSDYAAWEFIELIPFGRFIHFYKYCAGILGSKEMTDEFYLLQSVKTLRNACAHNNCILNDIRGGGAVHRPDRRVLRALSSIGIGRAARDTKMSNERIQHLATTLYLHQKLVPETMRQCRGEELGRLIARLGRNRDWYSANDVITSGFAFLEAMAVGWYGSYFC